MSTSYNKHTEGSRIGNWVEEGALKDMTGTSRYDTWCKEDDQGRTMIITKAVGVGKFTDTTKRVIYHTEHEDPSHYMSTTQDFHDPAKHAYVHTGRPDLGPRAAAMQRKFQEEASAKVPEEAPRQEWDTAARAAFVRHEQSAYTSPKGRRVMKTTDGKDLPPGCRDVEFLRAAHLTVPRGKLTEAQMERMAPDRSVESDVPVTLYTQRRGESVYSGTAAQGANPFARNSHFTNDIRDGREPHATAIDDISKVPHGIKPAATVAIGAELSIDVALRRFKARLADRAGVNGVRAMRHMLDRYDTSGDGQLSAAEFSAAMRDLRVDVTSREVAELVAYFDTDNSGRISLAELHAGLRPPIPDARLALVRRAFARADRGNDGAVTLDDLVQVLRGLNGGGAPTSAQMDNVKMVLAGLDSVPDGRVTLQEFVDYYADVSSMIPDDGEFEALMANCWKLHVAGASGGPKVKVLVIHNDSSQEVVEVSSQGVSKKDLPLIRALLRKAGVKSIHSVKVL